MLDNVLNLASKSGLEFAFRFGALLIAASLMSFLAIRLGMSLVSSVRVKARKQWNVQPATDQSLVARLLTGPDESTPQNFFTDDVKRLLDQSAIQPSKIGPDESGRPVS
jgi:hypothetical protein